MIILTMRVGSSDDEVGTGRRGWLAGLAGFVAVLLSRGARARGMPSGEPAAGPGGAPLGSDGLGSAPTPPAQKRILMVGDSMIAGAFGLFLERYLEREYGLSVDRSGKSSTGLSRPDFFNWLTEVERLRERGGPYDAVICMFGGNDGQGQFMGRRADPKWIRYGEAGWDDEYRRRVVAFADAATGGVSSIYWVGMPVMGLSRLHERMRHLNQIYRGELCIRPRAHFIDIWRTLADDQGRYIQRKRLGRKRVSLRASDGVHLTGAGATFLVEKVAPRIANHLLERSEDTFLGAPLVNKNEAPPSGDFTNEIASPQ